MVIYKTREEWLRKAVDLLNRDVFNGSLILEERQDLIDYQVSCALLNGRKLGEVVLPFEDNEDVSLDDFFPPTIHIDEKIKSPVEIIEVLAHECIHCFKNIRKHGKLFAKEAKAIGFEKPYTEIHANYDLASRCKAIAAELGEFPGKPVIPHKKETKKRKFSGKLFCPSCGYEVRISEKMFKDHNQEFPTCPCGQKFALDCTDEEDETEKE